MNCDTTNNNGFILSGSVKPASGEMWDVLLLKTDSNGNMQWYETYGSELQEQGVNAIQTPDGGYLIGGFVYDPAIYHTLDAMIIKTDSLGNEEWTKYYGNPNVDDDMALVAMANDGNYLVATVYGDNIMSNMYREGRIWIMKIDTLGNIIEEKKYGPSVISNQIKNMRKLENGYYVSSGFKFSYEDDYFKGWMFKFSDNIDSIWMRDYHYYNGFEETNFFYDASPTSDNGYIAVGQARPDGGGSTNKMWVVKVDSMGCDTPGCFTTIIDEEIFLNKNIGLRVWPNPYGDKVYITPLAPPLVPPNGGKGLRLRVYNSQGLKVEEVKIPNGNKTVTVNADHWPRGIYFVQLVVDGETLESGKIIKN